MASGGRSSQAEKTPESSDHPSTDSTTLDGKSPHIAVKEKADTGAEHYAVAEKLPVGAEGTYHTYFEVTKDEEILGKTPKRTDDANNVISNEIATEDTIFNDYIKPGGAQPTAVEEASAREGSTMSANEESVTTDTSAHEGSTLSADAKSVTTDASAQEGSTLSADEKSVTTDDDASILLKLDVTAKSGLQELASKSHRFLLPEETMALVRLQNDIGKFSYFITGEGKVEIYPEDDKSKENRDLLKDRFMEITNATANEFDVTVACSSSKWEFCTHRIGAKTSAGGWPGTVGMYISYNNIVYLVSCAHNLVLSSGITNLPRNSADERSEENRLSLDVMGTQVPIGPSYYVFSNKCNFMDKGRIILHSADILLCQAPIFADLMEQGKLQYSKSIQDGQDPCRVCDNAIEDCKVERHLIGHNPWRYTVSDFYDFGVPEAGSDHEMQYLRYNDNGLLNNDEALLYCRVRSGEVIGGKVVSFDNSAIFYDDQGGEFRVYNVLLIKAEKESAVPQKGDSGSVWVLDGKNLAVGITVGMHAGQHGKKLWAAAPIKPLLEQMSMKYPAKFPDALKFKPVRFKSIGSIATTEPSTLPSTRPSFTPSSDGAATRSDTAYGTSLQSTE